MFNAIEVLASGLSAARMRVNTLASNIANAETTRTPEGGPYKRRDVVQVATTIQSQFG
ncbi:MAG: flagellar basal body rod protein FlgC, partial [Bdellovibrionales bacterium]|nr:flagellar basal body rod protein FlgC [Bdellovibrionales bacterium]